MTPDVRCAVNLADVNFDGRCQLYVGHEDSHALLALVARAGDPPTRTLVRWAASRTVSREPFGELISVQLPWAPGYPSAVASARVASTDHAKLRHYADRSPSERSAGGRRLRAVHDVDRPVADDDGLRVIA